MNELLEASCASTASRPFSRARVLEHDGDSESLRVRVEGAQGHTVFEARALEAVQREPPRAGDTVLVAATSEGSRFVLGVLERRGSASGGERTIDLGHGAEARVSGPSRARTLRVYRGSDELVFEYDPRADKVRLCRESGDLELATARGDITLCSGGNVRVTGRSIVLAARSGIQLGVAGALGRLASLFALRRSGVSIRSPRVDAELERANLRAEDLQVEGRRLAGHFTRCRWTFDRLETVAGRVIERVGDLYRRVGGLAQLTAGRLRILVRSTCHLKARRAYLRSEEDFKVSGEKIHLG